MNEEKKTKKGIFQKLAILSNRHEFQIFLFIFSFLVFSWPFMTDFDDGLLFFPFAYYFGVWIILIAILIVSGLGAKHKQD